MIVPPEAIDRIIAERDRLRTALDESIALQLDGRDEKFLAWLLQSRTSIQRTLFELRAFVKLNRPQLESNKDITSILGLLVGSAFSLWRAAFLADGDRDWPTVLHRMESFLDTVVRDNTINYQEDKKQKDWTAGYYLNSARYRLYRAGDKMSDPQFDALILKVRETGVDETHALKAWDQMYEALQYALCKLKAQPLNVS